MEISGRIIRIINVDAIIINLGEENNVLTRDSVRILANAESITDPSTGEDLGSLRSIKGYGKVQTVYGKFSIVTIENTFFIEDDKYSELVSKVELTEIDRFVGVKEKIKLGDDVEIDIPDDRKDSENMGQPSEDIPF
jgi:hypothetical protein